MKVFFDTNVLLAAFAARGLCADLMRVALAEHQVMTGEVNLTELRRVLRLKLKASPEQINEVESLLRDQTVVAKPARTLAVSVRDKDDAWVLASAVAGDAALLVTGDKDLLSIASRAPLPILTPRAAWELLRRPEAT